MKVGKVIKIFRKVGYYEDREDCQPQNFWIQYLFLQLGLFLNQKVFGPNFFLQQKQQQ